MRPGEPEQLPSASGRAVIALGNDAIVVSHRRRESAGVKGGFFTWGIVFSALALEAVSTTYSC